MSELAGWLGGFTSAEGCINVNVTESHAVYPRVKLIQRITPVVGVFEGDGTISANVRKSTNSIGFGFQPGANIINTDTTLLRFIQYFLEDNNIKSKYYKFKRYEKLLVYGLDDLEKFLSLIYPYMIGIKKTQADIMLQEIIPRIRNKTHLSKSGFLELMKYVDLLNSTKGGKRGKYNYEYFYSLWFGESQ